MVGLLLNQGCIAVIPEATAICAVAAVGPEDPLFWVCEAIVTGSCYTVSSLMTSGIKDPLEICKRINMCSSDATVFG